MSEEPKQPGPWSPGSAILKWFQAMKEWREEQAKQFPAPEVAPKPLHTIPLAERKKLGLVDDPAPEKAVGPYDDQWRVE